MKLYVLDVSGDATRALELATDQEREYLERKKNKGDALMSLGSILLKRLAGPAGTNGANGKPHGSGGVEFNVSHDAGVVVMAVSTQKVGVDLCEVHPLWQDWMDDVSRGCFSKPQRREIGKDSREFAKWWSLKEAYLKRDGLGINAMTEDMCEKEGEWVTFDVGKRLVCSVVCEDLDIEQECLSLEDLVNKL